MDTLQSESFAKWCCNSRLRYRGWTEVYGNVCRTHDVHTDTFRTGSIPSEQRYQVYTEGQALASHYVSVQRHAMGRTVRGSNPGGGEIFGTRPDGLWGLTSLMSLY